MTAVEITETNQVTPLENLFGAMQTRDYSWASPATSLQRDRIAWYQTVREFFIARPMRQPALQKQILEFIDAKLAELTDELMGEAFRKALKAVIAEAEQDEYEQRKG
jgi:hypothetical protein